MCVVLKFGFEVKNHDFSAEPPELASQKMMLTRQLWVNWLRKPEEIFSNGQKYHKSMSLEPQEKIVRAPELQKTLA